MSSMFLIEAGIEICVNEVHSLKAKLPINVTDDGIEICVNDEKRQKAKIPIKVADDGIWICFNDEPGQKEEFPIEVTEEGIEICANDERSMRAELPIFIMNGGIFAVVTLFFVHISVSKFSLVDDLKTRILSSINLIRSFLFGIICIFSKFQHRVNNIISN